MRGLGKATALRLSWQVTSEKCLHIAFRSPFSVPVPVPAAAAPTSRPIVRPFSAPAPAPAAARISALAPAPAPAPPALATASISVTIPASARAPLISLVLADITTKTILSVRAFVLLAAGGRVCIVVSFLVHTVFLTSASVAVRVALFVSRLLPIARQIFPLLAALVITAPVPIPVHRERPFCRLELPTPAETPTSAALTPLFALALTPAPTGPTITPSILLCGSFV